MNVIDYAALFKPDSLVFPKPVKNEINYIEEFINGRLRRVYIENPNRYKQFPPGTLEEVKYDEDGAVVRLVRTKVKSSAEPALYMFNTYTEDGTKVGRYTFCIADKSFVMEDTVVLETNRLLRRRYICNGTICSYKGLPATSSYDKKTGELTEEIWAIEKRSGNRWYGTSITHRPVSEGPAIIRYKDGKIIERKFMENGKVRKDPADTITRKKRAITAGQVAEWITSQPENVSKLNEVLDVALQVSVRERR